MSARRKNSFTRKVRRAYSQDELARVLLLPEADFGRAFGMETVRLEPEKPWWHSDEYDGKYGSKLYSSKLSADSWQPPDRLYHFRDNGSKVLAVAHLDTVVEPGNRAVAFKNTQAGPLVVSGCLDDRLGAYVITRLLPAVGISCDWLFTTGEESGQSTASEFTAGKDYDHVIEFDRGGTDVVMYQYDDAATRAAVRAAGARVGSGSFSDIAYLEQLGVKCFNWGVGYEGNYHSEKGYAFLHNTFTMVARYMRFSEQNAGIAMPHEAERYEKDLYGGSAGWSYGGSTGSGRYYGSSRYDSSRYDYDAELVCDLCGEPKVDIDTRICGSCESCQDCGEFAEDCLCYVRHEHSGKPVGTPAPKLVTPFATVQLPALPAVPAQLTLPAAPAFTGPDTDDQQLTA